MIIKKIFEGIFDEEVHTNFLKFGKGDYKNKFLAEGKKQAKNWSIKTGAEDVNSLTRKCLEKVGHSVVIKGAIVSTLDLRNEAKFEIKKVSNFQGVRKHMIDGEISPEDIFSLMDKYPKAFFALSFKGDGFVLKTKPKAPSSGKSGKEKDSEPAVNFCTLKTTDKTFIDELFFGVQDFNNIRINHTIKITDIIYPANMSELKPTEIRERAKRKGIIVRTINSDGIIKTVEANFIV